MQSHVPQHADALHSCKGPLRVVSNQSTMVGCGIKAMREIAQLVQIREFSFAIPRSVQFAASNSIGFAFPSAGSVFPTLKFGFSTLKFCFSTLEFVFSTLKFILSTLKFVFSTLKFVSSTLKFVFDAFPLSEMGVQ